MPVARSPSVTPSPPGARKATSASSGTIARSSKSRIDTIRCPFGVEMSPRSCSICITIAVEVSTNPVPAISDGA